jgi:hypothetical protein
MTNISRLLVKTASVGLLLLMVMATPARSARSDGETYQANAFGEGTQMGRIFSVNILINEYSTAADQKALQEAFQAKGSRGLSNALNKMSSKGRIAITGTLGYEVTYIRAFQTPNGRKIRLVTNRPITFGEAWADSRSEDYNLSAIEIDLGSDGKGKGTLLPACQFKLNKENEIEIEALQNPWRLEGVRQ